MTPTPEARAAIKEAEDALLSAICAVMATDDVEDKHRLSTPIWHAQHHLWEITQTAALETRRAALEQLERAA